MVERVPYAIVGSGPAGTSAAEAIRRADPDAPIVVVSADPHPLYNRILLSKQFLKSDEIAPEQVVMRPREAYESRGIDLRTGVRVEVLDPEARSLHLADGSVIAFERCLIATGARPRELPVPGRDRPEVRALRSLEDAIALREAARKAGEGAGTAVLIGGGLIGVEVAAALAARGIAPVLLAREPWLFGHVGPEAVGRGIERILADGGVEVRLGTLARSIEPAGRDGARIVVEGPGDAGGDLVAPLVVVGVGVAYNGELLAGTGLRGRDGGVAVDRFLETDAEGIRAAGDVAAFDDPVLGVRHHVEHWTHALHQGRHAGLAMAGEAGPYERVSSYDTELFGTPIAVFGAPALATEWSTAGAPVEGEGLALGEAGGRLVAAYRIGAIGDPGELAGVIRRGAPAAELAAE
ncbi:MAG: FAD-dependent oxidoreductase [Gemmatimonadota bacterium]|nr:FAD-dependent oxidoreductase [Gemmatimonadota bacterium]